MKRIILSSAKKAAPSGSKRRKIIKAVLVRSGLLSVNNKEYEDWIKNVEPSLFVEPIKTGPKFSIVVPCFNTPDKYLEPLLQSVLGQTYSNWQLCMADGSNNKRAAKRIQEACKADSRVTYRKLEENKGIAGNTNEAINLTEGEYIVFMDHDDVLSIHALNELANVLINNPKAELIYSDEDLIDEKGTKRFSPFLKPDFSPDILLSHNYITHLVCVKKDLVDEVGMIHDGFEGAQDHDFLLRVTECAKGVEHVAKVLYHWRMADNSTAKDISKKSYATDSGVKAVKESLKRHNIKAKVSLHEKHPAQYRVEFLPDGSKTIVVLSESSLVAGQEGLDMFLDSLGKREHTKVYAPKTTRFSYPEHVKTYKGTFEEQIFAVANEDKEASIVCVSQPVTGLNKKWLNELVGPLQLERVAFTAPMVLDHDKRIVDFGLTKNGNLYEQIFDGLFFESPTYLGFADIPRDFSSISGNVFATKAQTIIKASNPKTIFGPEFFEKQACKTGFILGWPYSRLIRLPIASNCAYINSNLSLHRDHLSLQQPPKQYLSKLKKKEGQF